MRTECRVQRCVTSFRVWLPCRLNDKKFKRKTSIYVSIYLFVYLSIHLKKNPGILVHLEGLWPMLGHLGNNLIYKYRFFKNAEKSFAFTVKNEPGQNPLGSFLRSLAASLGHLAQHTVLPHIAAVLSRSAAVLLQSVAVQSKNSSYGFRG